MQVRQSIGVVGLVALFLGGCGDESSSTASSGAPAGPTVAEAGYITGKVTLEGGKPLTGEIKDIAISIHGVSEAAERVSYSPAVKPDGTYRQKVAGGQYGFNPSAITVITSGGEFRLPLEPVGNAWNKNRDAAEGISQDFVWKPKGPTPYGLSEGLNIGNHTHWYGLNVGLRADGYRNDIGKPPTTIPDNTKLTFTLKPEGKAIDGTEPKEPVIIERTFSSKTYAPIDINDLLPCSYEMTGVATLPDGSTKPLLLQGKGDYPGYKPSAKIRIEKDGIIGGMAKQPISFVIE